MSRLKHSPVSVLWKLGEWGAAQVSSSPFDHGSKLRGTAFETRRRHGCQCIVPSRHGGTLNSRRSASLVWLVEGDDRWETPDHPQGFLPLNWGGTKQKRTVASMVLKAKANDKRKF
ncbi:uncharacterized protein TNCV_2876061 [Trichonephila clavipes]|nr:uncharacterized protein TNCV_2876061 [Trichonephila clavipes]